MNKAYSKEKNSEGRSQTGINARGKGSKERKRKIQGMTSSTRNVGTA